MKVSKKLLSLLLVAVLLISAVPQALAVSTLYGYSIVLDGFTFTCSDEDGRVTEAELYDQCEVTKGTDAGIDASIARYTFPVDVTGDPVAFVINSTGSAPSQPSSDATEPSSDATEPSSDPTEPSSDPTDPSEPTTTYYNVTVDYTDGSEGEPVRSYEMVAGQQFGTSRLPAAPQRNGMTFKYWYYAANGTRVTADDTFNPDNGTSIKAKWDVAGLFLTLDENRVGEEYVNYGVTVTQGEAIWAKVSRYNPTRKGYVFMGWYLNGYKITPDTIYTWGDSATAYAKWEKAMEPGIPEPPEKDGTVWLEIYVNGKTGDLVKRVAMPASATKDEIITRAEVEAVAKKYVTPKAGYKLGYDGIFTEETWYFYTRDPETDGAASVEVSLYNDTYLFVMVKNVKTTTNGDPTNPKTGDTILTTALGLMAASGVAAAAVYVTGKKRK